VHPTLNQSAKGSGGVGSSNQELFSQGGAYLVPGEPIPFRKSKRACSTTDNETWVPADASNTLNNFDLGDTRTTHAVVQPVGFSMREDATNGTFDVKQVDTSLCLQALRPAVTSHHAQNIVVQPIAFTTEQTPKFNHDKALTLTKQSPTGGGQPQCVCHQMPGSVAPTIGASGPPYSRTGNERVEAEALAITFTPHIVQASELRLRGQITEQDTCPTLLANTNPAVNDSLAVHPICSQITVTLTVGHHSCAGHQHRMGDHSFLVGEAITFQPGNLRREAGSDPSTTTTTTTLKTSAGDQTPHVAIIAPCITASNDPSRSPQSSEVTQQVAAVHQATLAVRRLTPVECERLQGFPDNWSRISWKGKPEEDCPDGPRYKACGNSMAVPVMRWIGERIAAVDATLPPNA